MVESAVERETALPPSLDELMLAFLAVEGLAAVPPECAAIAALPVPRPPIELVAEDSERPEFRAGFDATPLPLPKECHCPSGVLRLPPPLIPVRPEPRPIDEAPKCAPAGGLAADPPPR